MTVPVTNMVNIYGYIKESDAEGTESILGKERNI